jgi:hypothetical protein
LSLGIIEMDLFQLAESVTPSVRSRYEAAVAGSSPEVAAAVGKFADKVTRDGRVAVNMRPWVLARLVLSGQYQNIHEWAQDQSQLCGRSYEEILQEKLGKYYVRRLAFDAFFGDGRKFRYGALNIGGLGAEKYGMFCVVLHQAFTEGGQVAYLALDSLSSYVDDAGHVDTVSLQDDLSCHSCCSLLAGLKHMGNLHGWTEERWPILVCSTDDYIEAIFLRKISTDVIDTVRIGRSRYDEVLDLAFGSFAKSLSDADRALIQDYCDIFRAERDHRIALERVDDD